MVRRVGSIGRLIVNVTVGWVLGVAGIVALVLYYLFPANHDDLVFFSALLGGLAVVHTAYYAATQLQIGVERDRMTRSFEIAQQVGEIDLVQIRVFAAKNIDHKDLSPSQVYNLIMENEEMHGAVRRLLGVFEDASIAVQLGYADEVMLERSLGYLVKWAQRTFGPYIAEVRAVNSSDLYVELDSLANAWTSKKYLSDGSSLTVPS